MASAYPYDETGQLENQFYDAFTELVDDAQVDFPTGEQYERILLEWMNSGRPQNVDEFIWERMQ